MLSVTKRKLISRSPQLIAHEFLFNQEMINGSNRKLTYALCCMLFGCGIMALLGRWA
jgi:zinc transporter 1/2/3